MMEATFFETPEDFRKWLEQHHQSENELIVGYYKKHTGVPSIDWPQSVDQALCFGWIDGIRRTIDKDRYTIRFTPRRKNSAWSQVNLRRIVELKELGLLYPAGEKIWMERNPKMQSLYSFEQGIVAFSEEFVEMLKSNRLAQENWDAMAPSYKKAATWWVMGAKQEVTRLKRMKILIECSEENLRVPTLRR